MNDRESPTDPTITVSPDKRKICIQKDGKFLFIRHDAWNDFIAYLQSSEAEGRRPAD